MANLLIQWGPTILRNMPYIIGSAAQLYGLYCSTKASNEEKKAVDQAMKLIEQNRENIDTLVQAMKMKEQNTGDVDRLMEDRRQMMAIIQGLAPLMQRLTQHYESHGTHHFPSSCCCQRPRDPPPCHHHVSREPLGFHPHGPRGLSDRKNHDHHHKGSHKTSACSCSAHDEMPQCLNQLRQELCDDEDHGSTASDSSSNWRKCILCDNNFNSTRRRPIILVCGHTICQECVGKLAALGPLRCPMCRTPERRTPATLPANVVLMAALEEGEQRRENWTLDNGGEDDWKKSSTLLQEEENLMIQRAILLSLKKDEPKKKTSSMLQEDEEALVQMAIQLSLDQEVGCSATVASKHDDRKDNDNLQTLMKIKDSCITIGDQIKNDVFPRVGSISLGLVEAQQCKKALLEIKWKLMAVNEQLMCHLEQLDGITFQDTDTQIRQSRKALVKKLLNLMDQCDRMQEKNNELMLNHM